jgi:hypothetical protein
MNNANTSGSIVAKVSIALDYGSWLAPMQSGPNHHLPGHNSSYKKHILTAYGNHLEKMLDVESILHWDLTKKGHQVYIESKAKAYHLNFEKPLPWFKAIFYSSWRFAGRRGSSVNFAKRLLFIFGSPLIPLIRGIRTLKNLSKREMLPNDIVPFSFVLFLGVSVCGIGEFIGYVFGAGRAEEKAGLHEFGRTKYLKKQTLTFIENHMYGI